MELDKIRNLSDGELKLEETKAAEQLFRLRFQMKLGQNEGVKKLRGLRKDIARIKTITRERELGLYGESPKLESSAPVKKASAKKTTVKKPAKKAAATTAAKSKTKKEAR
jgi:large subunit ribosomal protein L29